jgi:hypothetical protein
MVEEEIKRSDADFDWLRKTLLRLNPGHIVSCQKNVDPTIRKVYRFAFGIES